MSEQERREKNARRAARIQQRRNRVPAFCGVYSPPQPDKLAIALRKVLRTESSK